MKITTTIEPAHKTEGRKYPYWGYNKHFEWCVYFVEMNDHLVAINSLGELGSVRRININESDYTPFYGTITIKTEEG